MRTYSNNITKVEIQPNSIQWETKHSVLFLGSCFAEHIAEKSSQHGLHIETLPFGIQYNPVSIFRSIIQATQKPLHHFTSSDAFFQGELWHNWDFHSNYSDSNKQIALENWNSQLLKFESVLSTATHICISLGTSLAFELISENRIVNNCHKVNSTEFRHRLLENSELLKEGIHAISRIIEGNSNVQIVLTVSPVIHSNMPVSMHSRSKARLIELSHTLCERFSKNCVYFPAYELVREELRDYAYFESDGKHPNMAAVNHIWSALLETKWDSKLMEGMLYFKAITQAKAHILYGKQPIAESKFKASLQSKIEAGKSAYPFLNWSQFE